MPSHLVVLDQAVDIPERCETNQQRLLADIVVLRESSNTVIIEHIHAVDTPKVLPQELFWHEQLGREAIRLDFLPLCPLA